MSTSEYRLRIVIEGGAAFLAIVGLVAAVILAVGQP
jgi:hypothetical protein